MVAMILTFHDIFIGLLLLVNEAIGWEEAYDILQSQHQYPCCDLPPVNLVPGSEVFLFSATETSSYKRIRSKLADIASYSAWLCHHNCN